MIGSTATRCARYGTVQDSPLLFPSLLFSGEDHRHRLQSGPRAAAGEGGRALFTFLAANGLHPMLRWPYSIFLRIWNACWPV